MGGTKGCKPCKACKARACRFSAQLTCTHPHAPQPPIRPAPTRALCTAHRFPPRPGRAHRSNCSRSGPALAAQLRLQLTSTAPAPPPPRRSVQRSLRLRAFAHASRRPPAPAAAADATCATQCMPLAQQCTTMCSPAFLPCDRAIHAGWQALTRRCRCSDSDDRAVAKLPTQQGGGLRSHGLALSPYP